jgi:hypothetical protein
VRARQRRFFQKTGVMVGQMTSGTFGESGTVVPHSTTLARPPSPSPDSKQIRFFGSQKCSLLAPIKP